MRRFGNHRPPSPRTEPHAGRGWRVIRACTRACALACIPALAAGWSPLARAQGYSPVYVDDSPTAQEVLAQLPRLLAQNNPAEAASNVQRLLDEEPARLVAEAGDPALYRSVRERLHEALLASPALLERYRLTQEPRARRLLEVGKAGEVERSFLLTPSGFEAALALARGHFEAARFHAATRTLAQLETHPDFVSNPAMARRCAELALEIAPFAAGDEARRLALRLAERAGLSDEIDPASMRPVEPPPSARLRSIALTEMGPPFTPGELLPRPLRTAPIESASPAGEASALRRPRLSSGEFRPWAMPVLAGEMVLLSDGQRLTAWDRVTLQRLWQHAPSTEGERPAIELQGRVLRRITESDLIDAVTPAVSGGVAVAVLLPGIERTTTEFPQLHAVRATTGEALWSTMPSRLRTDWGDASISGPPIAAEGSVIVSVFQFSPLRRIMSAHLAAIDLYTGELRWSLLTGTAGVAPSQRLQRTAHLIEERAGVLYHTDPIGVVAATEAHSGRPLWVRRAPGEEGFAGTSRDEWEQPSPIIVGDTLVVLMPDQLSITVFDRWTGRVLGERPASELGWPEYLLRAGDRIVCVGPEMSSVRADALLTDEPIELAFPRDVRSPGRVRLAGADLLVPSASGALIVDASGRREPRRVELDEPGSPVAMGDQLIVADELYVHAYLPWSSAERTLRERLKASPDDPETALTYAELAYRAGAPERIPEAADAALEAIERLGRSERADQSRLRLYESLVSMLTADLTGGQSKTPVLELPLALRSAMVERLGTSAATPTQRVGHLMEAARLAGMQKDWEAAARAYQEILLDASLAGAEHVQGRRRQRADLAASGELRQLVREHPRAYETFDAEAAGRFAAITAPEDAPTAEAFESLARRYPASLAAPEALLRASELHANAGEPDRAASALELALATIESMPARRLPTGEIVGEIAGGLVVALAEEDRLFAASQVLERLRRERPGLKLTSRGEPIDPAALAGTLAQRLSALSRLPRVGHEPTRLAQTFLGWNALRPISAQGPVSTNHLLLHSPALGHVALFASGSEPTDELGFDASELLQSAPGPLRPIWSRPAPQGALPALVRLGPASALLLWGTGESASLELVDTVTGRTRWRTPAFGALFDEEPARRRTGMVETPLDGPSRLSDLMLVLSDHHAAIVERTGRAALFDLASGETLWAALLDVPVVYEAALGGGVLALTGERPPAPGAAAALGSVPVLAAYDARTRATLDIADDFGSLMRWVRVDSAGRVILGLDRGVIATDPRARSVRWVVDDPAVRLSGDAWLLEGRLIVLGPDRQAWQIDTASGVLRDQPLEDLGRLASSSRITLRGGPAGESAFATERGLIVFDRAGTLVGGDPTSGLALVLPPVPGDGLYAMLHTEGRPHIDEGALYRLWTLETPTGRVLGHADLRLMQEPRDLMLLDGLMVVGAPGAVLVYEAGPGAGATP